MRAFLGRILAGVVVMSVGCAEGSPPRAVPDAGGRDGGRDGGNGGSNGTQDGGPMCAEPNTSGAAVACPGVESNESLLTLLPPCTLPGVPECTSARCVSTGLLPAGTDPALLADCESEGSAGKCVPDPFVATQGQFLLSRCTAIGGVEGRCLSPCVPEVAANRASLTADICQDGWLCSPCVNPLTGEATGACTQGCDPGPGGGSGCNRDGGVTEVIPPTPCCGSLGVCVATDVVPAGDRGQLAPLECASDQLCVPTALASGRPATCNAFGALRAEGRCLPACLPDIAEQADTLDQGLCDPGYLCAPCFDPRSGEPTGACTRNGDTPAEPPTTFPACCGGAGRCVTSRAAGMDAMSLQTEDCTEGLLCAPAGAIDNPDEFAFPGCTIPAKMIELLGLPIMIPESPGACIPECFMPDSDQSMLDLLDQLFPSGEGNPCEGAICAPCTHPLTGADTGACR